MLFWGNAMCVQIILWNLIALQHESTGIVQRIPHSTFQKHGSFQNAIRRVIILIGYDTLWCVSIHSTRSLKYVKHSENTYQVDTIFNGKSVFEMFILQMCYPCRWNATYFGYMFFVLTRYFVVSTMGNMQLTPKRMASMTRPRGT